MDYDANEARRRRELGRAIAAKAELEAKLAEVARQARSAKARLLATTKAEGWHRHALAWLDRDAGYTGEMASARVYLRSLPFADYVKVIAAHATAGGRNIDAEVAAVAANLEEWTRKGDDLLLDRARRDYAAEVESFRQWEKDNPDRKGWRGQPSTRLQWFQISRNAERLGLDMPVRLNRGEAHDWIEAHGGNLRLAADEPSSDGVAGGFVARSDNGVGVNGADVLQITGDGSAPPAPVESAQGIASATSDYAADWAGEITSVSLQPGTRQGDLS